jgi:hypothetical protein
MATASYSAPVEELAREAAGNWRKFESFAWFDKPEDAEKWTVVYTHSRDSRLLEQSNAAAIEKAMKPFLGRTARAENHNHWACGWIAGYAIRVCGRNGRVTKAFKAWCELQAKLQDYPVLDEEDYSQRELNATFENLAETGKRFLSDNPPDDWVGQVYDALPDREKENRDDHGGYPSDEAVMDALCSLGLLHADYIREAVENAGPQEGDITTQDHVRFWQDGKIILEQQESGNWLSPLIGKMIGQGDWKWAVREWTEIDSYCPNIWLISDHGNAHLIDLE